MTKKYKLHVLAFALSVTVVAKMFNHSQDHYFKTDASLETFTAVQVGIKA